ncbi:hypothetical protein CLAIMM_12079 [Cladophialophora immunda]|nr:hypothetical protein CLAIMM_12079 [Cladophialophora immunda]
MLGHQGILDRRGVADKPVLVFTRAKRKPDSGLNASANLTLVVEKFRLELNISSPHHRLRLFEVVVVVPAIRYNPTAAVELRSIARKIRTIAAHRQNPHTPNPFIPGSSSPSRALSLSFFQVARLKIQSACYW